MGRHYCCLTPNLTKHPHPPLMLFAPEPVVFGLQITKDAGEKGEVFFEGFDFLFGGDHGVFAFRVCFRLTEGILAALLTNVNIYLLWLLTFS